MNWDLFIPLSPPISPPMSAHQKLAGDTEWLNRQNRYSDNSSLGPSAGMALMYAEVSRPAVDMQWRPLLRSHKSFPHSLGTQSRVFSHAQSPIITPTTSLLANRERVSSGYVDNPDPINLPTVNFGGSAPTSPVCGLSPTSEKADGREREERQDLSGADDDCDNAEGGDEQRPHMTVAELRAHKRKMKRFRLTHNQTRFLMNEFARQAHPDAAQRERLAREIPGLSPRQVQVWFQNRRAKLKRLTSDDRERIMRSRAVPDDFDMIQALHAPFGGPHGVGTPLATPTNYSSAFPEANMIGPFGLDTPRKIPGDTNMSPTVINSEFERFNIMSTQSAVDTLSPNSIGTDTAPFDSSQQALDGSSSRGNPFGGSPSPVSAGYIPNAQIPKLHLQTGVDRTRAESLCSPLRTSVSYPSPKDGFAANGISSYRALSSASLTSEQLNSHPSSAGNVLPYGFGYPYSRTSGFQAGASMRMRSFSTGVPRRIELDTHYTSSQQAATPQTATFPIYQRSPLVTPQNLSMAHSSAPHHITSFENSLRQDSQHTHPFPSIGTVVEGIDAAAVDMEDTINGGVALLPTF